MKPYYHDDRSGITLYHGDCREILPTLGPFECCVTDPPYGLAFMGKDWDRGVPGEHFWALVSAALLPGAPLLAFGGTRTWHRLACAIEDAGFELRDTLCWLYGQGFPKSLSLSVAFDKASGMKHRGIGFTTAGYTKSATIPGGSLPAHVGKTDQARTWQGYGTALKPAWEPILLAMKPLDGTFAQNAQRHGVAGLNVDGARIEAAGCSPGRWPANVCLDCEAAAMLDEQSASRIHSAGAARAAKERSRYSGGTVQFCNVSGDGGARFGDSGGASRFYFTAKASNSDRGHRKGERLPLFDEDEIQIRNEHPTVKPTALMRWLCTLTMTPTGGTVLDPFMGSGSTLVAAKQVGRPAVGCELEERYCEIAARRLSRTSSGSARAMRFLPVGDSSPAGTDTAPAGPGSSGQD